MIDHARYDSFERDKINEAILLNIITDSRYVP
jgi:hypothetical protein